MNFVKFYIIDGLDTTGLSRNNRRALLKVPLIVNS